MDKESNDILQALRVLVVTGVGGVQESMTALLRELGCDSIKTTDTSAEAVRLAAEGEVELIIADWSSSELGGLEVLKAIRAHSTSQSVPFVMTASTEDRENLVEAICAGASSLLVVSQDDRASLLKTLRARLETVLELNKKTGSPPKIS